MEIEANSENIQELRRQYDDRLAPAEVGELTGVGPDTQRDWRRRGLIEDLGKQDAHGRWRYSSYDCLTLWIARRLVDAGFNIADVVPVAMISAGKLTRSKNTFLWMRRRADIARGEAPTLNGDGTLVTRYMVLYLDGEWGFRETDNLNEMFKSGWPVAHVVDLWHLAATAPKDLVAEIFPDAA